MAAHGHTVPSIMVDNVYWLTIPPLYCHIVQYYYKEIHNVMQSTLCDSISIYFFTKLV